MLPLIIIAVAIAVAIAATIVGNDRPFGLDLDRLLPMVGLTLMALSIGAGAIGGYRGRIGEGLKAALVWVAIALALVAGYAFRFELASAGNRVVGVVAPGVMLFGSGGEVTVSRAPDGQFHFRAIADGKPVRMMFDTGATSVVLTYEDAGAMGLRLRDDDFSISVRTANGVTRAAPVVLKSLEIGGIREEQVRAMVAQPGRLSENLLGMTFLERLASYEVRGDQLTIRGRGG
jgi:aspartyl protease family protein